MTNVNVGKDITIQALQQHFDAVNKQLERVPVEFPQLEISEDLSQKNIDDITEEMFSIKDYKSYDKISAPMIA